MTVEFKFKIGDIVSVIGSATTTQRGWGMQDQRWLILEQWTQTCTAGTQLSYRCRGVTPDGGISKEIYLLNECEIQASEAFTVNPKG